QDGKPEKETVRLERPKVFHAVVFNGEQIDGLPPLKLRPLSWNPDERAENILKNSGAVIDHRHGDRAFYSPSRDSITLPLREQFESPGAYYETALHELGHWTGHADRLNRDLSHPFGSEGYAREELRAEIASLMLSQELGVSFNPGQHASYVASWIMVLQDDPMEIMRAASDAEKIQG
ncbi:ArdC family protein, partial [Neisseria gonorrhoeae]